MEQQGSFRQHELRGADLEKLFPGVLRGILATFVLKLPQRATAAATAGR
jgi:hypothetical protein